MESHSDKGKQYEATHVVVKELFTKPNGKYPNGRYVVVGGNVLLKQMDELPYEFGGENPYPVVEFVDVQMAGQFWPTTIVEQLISLQKEYNLIQFEDCGTTEVDGVSEVAGGETAPDSRRGMDE
jgi:hypothetical protein